MLTTLRRIENHRVAIGPLAKIRPSRAHARPIASQDQ